MNNDENEAIIIKTEENKSSYKALLEKPEIIGILISLLIAFFSVYTGYMAYIYQCLRARVWNIPLDMVKISFGSKGYYYVIANILFFFIYSFIIALTSFLFRRNINKRNSIYYRREIISYKKAKVSELKKKSKIKSNKTLLKNISDNYTEIIDLQKKNISIKLYNIFYGIIYFVILMIAVFPVLFSFLTLLEIIKDSTELLILITVFFYIVIFVIAYNDAEGFAKENSLNQIKADIRLIKREYNSYKILKDRLESCEKAIPLSFKLGDFSLFKLIMCSAIVIVLYAGLISSILIYQGINDSNNKKEFSIFTENNESYAVVFQDDNINVLEKIEIQDKVAQIYTKEQRYISYEDLEVHIEKFDNIEIVK